MNAADAPSCPFCRISSGIAAGHEVVWQDDAHVAFLNIRPVQPYHLLVIPRTHVDYAFDMPPADFASLLEASRKLALPLRTVSGAKRIALAIDGFHVPHAHVHLIPVNATGELCHQAHDAQPEELAPAGVALRAACAHL